MTMICLLQQIQFPFTKFNTVILFIFNVQYIDVCIQIYILKMIDSLLLTTTLDRLYRCDKASPCCRVDWCEGSDRVVERSWKCIINADCRGTPQFCSPCCDAVLQCCSYAFNAFKQIKMLKCRNGVFCCTLGCCSVAPFNFMIFPAALCKSPRPPAPHTASPLRTELGSS